MTSKNLIGLRVRELAIAERATEPRYADKAWCVEGGYPQADGEYAEPRIISRHDTEVAASKALCEMLKRGIPSR